LGLTALTLKIRTPCDFSTIATSPAGFSQDLPFCTALNRYDLFYSQPIDKTLTYGGNDPIVSWQINGLNGNNNFASLVLQPNLNDYVDSTGWKTSTAIIYAGKIDSRKSDNLYDVLNESKLGLDYQNNLGSILDFLKNNNSPTETAWQAQKIIKPILKISVIHSLQFTSNSKDQVPYLEYQLLIGMTNSNSLAPADNAQTITAEAVNGGAKVFLENKVDQQTGLVQYVVQQ